MHIACGQHTIIYELSIWGKHGVRNAAKINNGPSVEKCASRTAKTSVTCIEKLVKKRVVSYFSTMKV